RGGAAGVVPVQRGVVAREQALALLYGLGREREVLQQDGVVAEALARGVVGRPEADARAVVEEEPEAVHGGAPPQPASTMIVVPSAVSSSITRPSSASRKSVMAAGSTSRGVSM